MLEIYDRNRKKLAILENAFDISETLRINAVNGFIFSLPDNDRKIKYCERFNLIRYNRGEFYRIIMDDSQESETGSVTYECEHVIALLIDTIMPDFVATGVFAKYTKDVINYVLSRQHTKHWALKECDFRHQYEYGWEKENLLSALFSISNRFTDDYIWKFDTSVYPYQLSLKKLDLKGNPRKSNFYVRKGHNRLALSAQSDSRNICTQLYPYGVGEGVNQLTIANLTEHGFNYIQSPPEYIEKYGVIQRAWTDRRYIDEESLLQAAQVMLKELQEPYAQYETEIAGEQPEIGDIIEIVGVMKSVVVEKNIRHDEVPQTTIKIANRPKDIASTVADLADRQRIEMTYSQGATQIYADSIADNADDKTPLELRFYLPDTMIHINAVECRIRISRFRAYNENVVAGGKGEVEISGGGTTTSSGGGVTTSSGGGGSITSGTSQEQSATSQGGGGQRYGTEYSPGNATHNHALTTIDHTHGFTIPQHSHVVVINAHTHNTDSHTHTVPSHTHKFEFSHTHDITPKISFFGNPTSFTLLINGEKKEIFENIDKQLNITDYLVDETKRKIERGKWHTIGVLPNDLARIEISYSIVGFIQSRGEKTV